VDTVIYPPVDTEIFKPIVPVENDVIIIYTGSKALDTPPKLVHELIEIAFSQGLKVNVFGENVDQIMHSHDMSNKIINGVKIYKNLSDHELAKLYSESYVVIAPQYFELFGYVPVEAMACGAPVITFGYLGPSETVVNSVTGFLAYSDEDMKNILKVLIKERPEFDRHFIRNYITKKFSINAFMESDRHGI